MNANSSNNNKKKEFLKNSIVSGLAAASPLVVGLTLPDGLISKEKFGNGNGNRNENRNENENNQDTITLILMKLFNLVIGIYAIYLSFACNKSGFNLGAFLVACCCPWLYIIYAFAALKCFK
jgi:hypothetical protein